MVANKKIEEIVKGAIEEPIRSRIVMKKRWILYTGHFHFPWGQAASRRVYGNAMALCNAGYNVVVASGSEQPATLKILDKASNVSTLSHVGLGTSPNESDNSFNKTIRLLFSAQKTIQWIDKQVEKPSCIILYGGYVPYMIFFLYWCKKNSIPLIADVVEWYGSNNGLLEKLNLSYLNVELSHQYLFPKCDGIIAISSYLHNYYIRNGCNSVKIPPTINLNNFEVKSFSKKTHQPLTLVYAGTPGKKKDLLSNVVEAVGLVDAYGKNIKLIIVGPTVDDVQKLCKNKILHRSVHVMGRLPQAKVAKIVSSADFSVLLREPFRFAQAGFPTKFVESLANGTPVIANITSDLGDYLHDGINGFICRDYTVQSLVEAINRASNLSYQELKDMRYEANMTACNYFDYRNYSDKISSFIESIIR